MEKFNKKSFTTSRSLTYVFYDSAPTTEQSGSSFALLFLHGYPDSAQIWYEVAPKLLSSSASRIIIPDLLGYGDTAKPTDPAAYDSKSMAIDLAELLTSEGIAYTIPIGHDWGSFLAQRLYFWAPERVAGLVMLNVAYMPPFERDFDLDRLNADAERVTGLPRWSYWDFYASDAASAICCAHADSLWCAIHSVREDLRRSLYSTKGALQSFLEDNEKSPVRSYEVAGRDLKSEWLVRMEKNGFEGPLCWYKAIVRGITPAAESELDRDRLVVKVPALFIGASKDQICLIGAIRAPWAEGFLPDLQIKQVDSFHRPMLERPEELALSIKHWLIEKFG
ncbi:soluble epoxide hydrolase / lipid-phosphate phosphatase [Alternaria panax]|uniref:Soluble epoxide hydrolase / lipid-phosphate phosphatase n=1 Tax=Alternaria panax TaxID=48097 RepID=A0AAD4I7U5_9PLEO|nr:soluble epoxide hydrolase / lipid-phosphate phosphatase [Alternaria panax]